jgi:hypothetical protein
LKKVPKRLKRLKRKLPKKREVSLAAQVKKIEPILKEHFNYMPAKKLWKLMTEPSTTVEGRRSFLEFMDVFAGSKPLLRAGLRHRNAYTREISAIALGRLGEVKVAPKLMKIISSSKFERHSALAIEALTGFPPKKALSLLKKVYHNKVLPAWVRGDALEAIGDKRIPGGLEFLIPIAEMTEHENRYAGGYRTWPKTKGEGKQQRVLSKMKLDALNGVSDYGKSGSVKAVATMARIYMGPGGFDSGIGTHASSAGYWLRYMVEQSKLLTGPGNERLKKKVWLARDVLGKDSMGTWLTLNAILLMPKVNRSCPETRKDRNGMDFLHSIKHHIKNKQFKYVYKALGLDKVK